MENKYYTPTIEELKEGFRYLQEIYDEEKDEYTGKYKVNIFDVRSGLGHDDYHTFTEGRVLCKYLDKQDIKDLGFVQCLKSYDYTYDENHPLLYFEKSNTVELYMENTKVTIYKSRVCVFKGTIKNKSELIILLKQLNIQ